jgi:hypothetical protein
VCVHFSQIVKYVVVILKVKIVKIFQEMQYVLLNPTHENNGCISFLDFLIIRKPSNLEIHIFSKPTTTDTTIILLSNHHMKHKIATYRHYITRMPSLPLTPKRKQTEWTLIQLIAQNTNFPQKFIQHLNLQIQQQ